MQVKLNNVVVTFPFLREPQVGTAQNGQPAPAAAYTITAHLLPEDPQLTVAKDAVIAVAKAKWPDPKIHLPIINSTTKPAIGDGDQSSTAGFAGTRFIRSRATVGRNARPRVFGKDNKEIFGEGMSIIYSGCVCNVIVDAWAQANTHGKRVNWTLLGVQFVADGEPLGGGARLNENDAFSPLTGDALDGADLM